MPHWKVSKLSACLLRQKAAASLSPGTFLKHRAAWDYKRASAAPTHGKAAQ